MPFVNTQRQNIGRMGEDAATRLLLNKRIKILEGNWRGGGQEIDIIALDKDTIVFVEVRTRRRGSKVCAIESITTAKQNTMRKGAEEYLTRTAQWDTPCRFDIITVEYSSKDDLTLEHYCNVL